MIPQFRDEKADALQMMRKKKQLKCTFTRCLLCGADQPLMQLRHNYFRQHMQVHKIYEAISYNSV